MERVHRAMKRGELRCLRCGAEPAADWAFEECPACRQDGVSVNYTTVLNLGETGSSLGGADQPGIWKYRRLYPVGPDAVPVSLDEGGTPLLRLGRFGARLGMSNLYVKDEGRGPTWSHKDRMASVGITMAREMGTRVIAVASSGNQGAATAAYAARAGLKCVAFTTTSVPRTMKILMQSYGALVVATNASRDRWRLMRRCVEKLGWFPMSGFVYPPIGSNPLAIDGYKSIAVEVVQQLGRVPGKIVVPTAYGDLLYGMWKGFLDLRQLGLIERLPVMLAVEPYGPLEKTLHTGSEFPLEVAGKGSVAFSIGNSMATYQALRVLRDSGGDAITVSDDAAMRTQRQLAGDEGLYAEPSSAMALASVEGLLNRGSITAGDTVVVLLTSTGLKDPAATAQHLPEVPVVEPDMDALSAVLLEAYGFEKCNE